MRTSSLVIMAALALGACKTRSHEQAIQATFAECERFHAALASGARCGLLADRVEAVADPFGDVSNDKPISEADETELTRCMDAIAEHAPRCKGDRAYARAMDRLIGAMMK